MKLAEINNKIYQLYEEVDHYKELQTESLKRTLFKCEKCGRKKRISKLIFYSIQRYVKPYSCNEGDYWSTTHGEIICSYCSHRHHLELRTDWKQSIDKWWDLTEYFGEFITIKNK